ncbi:MAG: bile acid:sodium symporter family protein [bacterium]|nr:bile acid:sodium symporter family protein [bacterium]
MPPDIDSVRLHFDQTTLTLLNVILGFVMYGVALDIRVDDFRRVLRDPRPVVIGFVSQFILLPALSCALLLLFAPHPALALGVLLVACCPGGNISNFITQLARGNAALSVTLTACATLTATALLPLNFALWTTVWARFAAGSGKPPIAVPELRVLDMTFVAFTLLALPLFAGMFTARRWPGTARALRNILRGLSLMFLGLFIAGALYANWAHFVNYISQIVGLVFLHNAAALCAGYFAAKLGGQPEANRRAILFETGIQNSGLALVLIFDFFDGRGGLALVAAWWGVWHIISGLSLAAWFYFRDRGQAGVRRFTSDSQD